VIRDQRGGVLVETLIAFPVLLFSFLGIYMLAFIFCGHLVLKRAADAAARAAIVYLPDHPYYFERGPSKKDSVDIAARLALDASYHMVLDAVECTPHPDHYEPLRAEVRAHFDCSPFLAGFMCGPDRNVPMRAAATLPYQRGFSLR
jgi:hypothetical protein